MESIGLVGCGSLGIIIARGVRERLKGKYMLRGVCDAQYSRAVKLGEALGCAAYSSVRELLAHTPPDYIVEAAGGGALKSITFEALEAGCDIIALSIGAFADEVFYQKAMDVAESLGRKIHVVSGAIGGLDIIRSAMWLGELKASITSAKPPLALKDAPYLEGRVLSLTDNEEVFSGSARDAIKAFPKNVNVAVSLALTSNGVDKTNVKVVSMPSLKLNTHIIELEGDFGRAKLEIASKPSENAGSSELAAYSVLAKLENLSRAIQF